jgi:type 1 fimbria pilin
MHTLSRIATGAALMGALNGALASSSVDLQISGSIIPGGCTPTLNATHIDHGKIAAQDLNVDQPTSFAARPRETTLLIACQAATLYGLRTIDNRADSVFESGNLTYLGLGRTPAGENIGAHLLRIVPTRSSVDDKPAFVTLGNQDATRWLPAEGNPRSLRGQGYLAGLTNTAGVSTGPIPIKDAVVGLSSSLLIAPASGLTLTDAVTLDGHVTVEVVYL